MQWRNWQKIASRWRFELDAKSGPLEAGDFGENGDFGKNRQRAGDNSDKRPSPLETGNFGENGDCSEIGNFGKNRQKCMQWRKRQKIPASGDLNWMPKVAPWRLAILAKIARGLAICGKIFKLDAKSGPFKVDNYRGPYNCEATVLKKKFKLHA